MAHGHGSLELDGPAIAAVEHFTSGVNDGRGIAVRVPQHTVQSAQRQVRHVPGPQRNRPAIATVDLDRLEQDRLGLAAGAGAGATPVALFDNVHFARHFFDCMGANQTLRQAGDCCNSAASRLNYPERNSGTSS